jgi:hypothetical protein
MKTQRQQHPGRGIMLVDCLIYLAVTAVLVGLGMALFIRCLGAASDLSRNADDIAAALQAGERWRADLRLATAPPAFAGAETPELNIPQAGGSVTYRFTEEAVWRRAGSETTWTRLLERVKHAEWNTDPRGPVTAWHFDVELKSRRPNAKVRPLFSFIGVAPEGARP